MLQRKIRVGILFGGRSAEHAISLLSAKSIIEALDPLKYEAVLIAIDKQGQWHLKEASQYLLHEEDAEKIQLHGKEQALVLLPKSHKKEIACCLDNHIQETLQLDVIFPVLHGTYGEDGTIQGLLKLANIPFVGAGVLGSAIGMDKDIAKRLLRDAGIPIAPFMTLRQKQIASVSFEEVVAQLGLPLFIKPANAGSSVGVTKVTTQEQWLSALQKAFTFDQKVLCEAYIEGREIECSVLGNETPIASMPGEVIVHDEFYSYEAKYLHQGASFEIPALLPSQIMEKIQQMALRVYEILGCEGMARVDFFVRPDHTIIVNEINTIPGFTKVSMYPKMWEKSGLAYKDLLDQLVMLALERFEREKRLETTYAPTPSVSTH